MPPNSLARLPQRVSLWRTLVAQDVAVRYRGTMLGRAWPLLMPLVMLAVYGLVFGAIFRARWPGLAQDDHLGFTLNLFIGLLVHGLLAEAIGQAPTLFQRNSNFVRKMVFPLSVLVAVPLGTALFHASLGMALLIIVAGLFGSGWHLSIIAVPLILAPYLALLYGVALVFSALGVYVRDLGQFVAVIVMVTLFTGTVFFPRTMVPDAVAGIVDYNPITWPTEALRGCILHGVWPDPASVLLYSLAALVVLLAGRQLFSVLRRGFADLL